MEDEALVARPSAASAALPLMALGQQPTPLWAQGREHMVFQNVSIFSETNHITIQFKMNKIQML